MLLDDAPIITEKEPPMHAVQYEEDGDPITELYVPVLHIEHCVWELEARTVLNVPAMHNVQTPDAI